MATVGNLRVSSHAVEFDLFTHSYETAQNVTSKLEEIGSLVTLRKLNSRTHANRPKEEALAEAVKLFNEERFWEVHETLEDLWRKASGDSRELLQGLILLAASYVHFQKGRNEQVRTVLKRAQRKIQASNIDEYGDFHLRLIKKKIQSFLNGEKPYPFKLGEHKKTHSDNSPNYKLTDEYPRSEVRH